MAKGFGERLRTVCYVPDVYRRKNNQVFIAEKLSHTVIYSFLTYLCCLPWHCWFSIILPWETVLVGKDNLKVLPNKVNVKPFHLRNYGHNGDYRTFLKLAFFFLHKLISCFGILLDLLPFSGLIFIKVCGWKRMFSHLVICRIWGPRNRCFWEMGTSCVN